MIGEALTFVGRSLDRYLMNRFGLDESAVVLNSLLDQDGSVPQKNHNKIVLTLINLDAETSRQFYGGEGRQGGNVTKLNPTTRFNLVVLFAASFDDYDEALKFLGATICYFQANSVLSAHTSPDIPGGIEKLQFEVENITFHQMQNLWQSMAAKYLPSVLYRVRHVNVQANAIRGSVGEIRNVESELLLQ